MHSLSTLCSRNLAYFRSTISGFSCTMTKIDILHNQLGHWHKFHKLHIYPLSTLVGRNYVSLQVLLRTIYRTIFDIAKWTINCTNSLLPMKSSTLGRSPVCSGLSTIGSLSSQIFTLASQGISHGPGCLKSTSMLPLPKRQKRLIYFSVRVFLVRSRLNTSNGVVNVQDNVSQYMYFIGIVC